MFSETPLFGQRGARRTRSVTVASVFNFVVAGVTSVAWFITKWRLGTTMHGWVSDARAAVTAQLVEADVGANAAVAGMAEFRTSGKGNIKSRPVLTHSIFPFSLIRRYLLSCTIFGIHISLLLRLGSHILFADKSKIVSKKAERLY